jgi:transposase
MKLKEVIGIDVGKESNEGRIHSSQKFLTFENNTKGFEKFVEWVSKNSSSEKEQLLFAFEHTGLYSFPLAVFLTEKNYVFVLLPGLELKRSMGITRGKDDKMDAKRIAQYAYEKRDSIKPYIMPQEEIIQLKRLLTLRERLVKQCSGYKASLCEYKQFLKKKDNLTLFETQEQMIKYLSKYIEKIDNELSSIIKKNDQLKQMYDLIVSIKGVGPQTALFMISYTHGFTRFETWRQFASYCGVAPFPYQSGISIRGRTKVNNLANKKIKSLLDLCAKSSIQFNMEMKMYYEKRVNEGKTKMGTINIIRNKILSRIFATVRRGTPYVNTIAYQS